ncbi:MAG: hypothetical protein HQ565_10755 [Bacteroidetes bacterium]|nr:hypothetical protein [Bacteroidota bacterium]
MNTNYLKKIIHPLRKYPSRIIIWVSLLIITAVNISYENWNNEYKVISWDVNSYYAYLPMVFIYQDIDMDFMEQDFEKHKIHYWPHETKNGEKVIITSMGMAYLYAPFFLAGHGLVHLTGYAGDEFSAPYKIALIVSCLFYLTIGLIFLRKVLRMYFSEPVTSMSLLIIVFGTNLLHYVTEEPTMTHAYSFSLISIFLYLITRWVSYPGIKLAILTGALAGLITLIRPTNILFIILLILWGITSFRDLLDRFRFYLRNLHLVMIMIMAFFIIWIPQFLYWYHVSGSILLNTYGMDGYGFFFNNPQVYHTLLSYRKGWLVYTPVMIFAIFGLYMLYKEHRKLFLPVLIYLLVNVYVISSWWCWWYGGGFGLRPFIDSYGIMSLPLAAFLSWSLRQKNLIKYTILLMLVGMMYVNIFQVIQYKKGLIHYVMMSKETYWVSFLNMKLHRNYWNSIIRPDYGAAKKGEYYTKAEIPFGLEKKLGMTGREYINQLMDTIANQPEQLDDILRHKKNGISVDSLIYLEAIRRFDQVVERYHEMKNK